MGWLFWMFVVWFMVGRFARRRRRHAFWMMGPGVWWMMMDGSPCHPRRMHTRGIVIPGPARELNPRERRERAMADLRRRYVADEISVEEYEAGLDRVLRD